MSSRLTKPSRFIFAALLVLSIKPVYAQVDNRDFAKHIDSFLMAGRPKSALALANQFDSLSIKHNDIPGQITAVTYYVKIQTVGDDNLVAAVKHLTTRMNGSVYPVKPILQFYLALFYNRYYQHNSYRIKQRDKLQHPTKDFTEWDGKTLLNQVAHLYLASLADAGKEQATPVSALGKNNLYGDTTNRSLRPTLYDLLLHYALGFFLSNNATTATADSRFILNDPRLFADAQTFSQLQITTADTTLTYYKGLKYLQQATLFHLAKQNQSAVADLDLQRLAFLHDQSQLANRDTLYVTGLRRIAEKYADSPISADALAMLGKFYRVYDKKTALAFYLKAVATYPQSAGGMVAAEGINGITQTIASATVEAVNPPDVPLLAQLHFHNLKNASVTLYKIWATQYNELNAMRDTRYGYFGTQLQPVPKVYDYLKKLKPYLTETLQLPAVDDYEEHTTEFKIDPLPTGIYVLIVHDPASDSVETFQLTSFKVTHLASVSRYLPNGQTQITVLDRETGAPLQNVEVTADETQVQKSNMNGAAFFNLNGKTSYAIKLTTTTDTLYTNQAYRDQRSYTNPEAVKSLKFFTDRTIYRPGQTVYFKGICTVTQHDSTRLMTGENVVCTISGSNQATLAKLTFKTNAFGSFSGSYTIPRDVLNGYIHINTIDPNSSHFIRVEEYKRPNFRLDFLPVTKTYNINDSVDVKGKVLAYSGYGLSFTRVAVHITRMRQWIDYRKIDRRNQLNYSTDDILIDTIKANARGEFDIKLKATVNEDTASNIKYRYTINAVATDGSGETQSANTGFTVALKNIAAQALVPVQANPNDTLKIWASVRNLDNLTQAGDISMRIFSLKAATHLYKNRLWSLPDKYLMSKADYEKYFADYTYAGEDDEKKWPVVSMLAEFTKHTDDKNYALFTTNALKNQPTGVYKVVVSVKNTRGDTASQSYYVHLLSKPAKQVSFTNWANNVTSAAGNNTANVLFNLGKNGNVLIEQYANGNITNTNWMHIKDADQHLITAHAEPGQANQGMQLLAYYHNRQYSHYISVGPVEANRKNLDIKFITFRNKLQPGANEEWKLQLSGNDHHQAELVAAMYDASLDAIDNTGFNDWPYNRLLYPQSKPFAYNWSYPNLSQSFTSPFKYVNHYFPDVRRNYEQLLPLFQEQDPNQIFMAYDELRIRGTVSPMSLDGPVGNGDKVVMNEITTRPGVKYDKDVLLYSTAQIRLNGADYLHADSVDDYGDQAGKSGPVIPRKNFSETAFFYPQLHTDSAGNILISFTVPESLTTWHFKAFAHTKELQTGYIEQEAITQKQLSIISNTPRFLREGDTITVSATLANVTAGELNGTVKLRLFNAVNMQPVNLLVNPADAEQKFHLAANTNQPIAFKLAIPTGLDALTYRITAEAGQYSDGEENTLPVLSNRTLVTETMPMMVRGGQTKSFVFNKLANPASATLKSKILTLEYTQNPAWYAVQALPYLMEFPYDCSEEIFNRYYSNSFATSIINHSPQLKGVFDQWKSNSSDELLSALEKNQELKSTIIQETPWLQDAVNESGQKQRIATLFDLNNMRYELKSTLDKLGNMQLRDGSFPWFSGEIADRYITQYILAGMGQLYHLKVVDLNDQQFKSVADKTIAYLDKQIQNDAANGDRNYAKRILSPLEIHSYYAQSYFTSRKLSAESQSLLNNYLNLAAAQWVRQSQYEQAMIALTMLRNNHPLVAASIIRSLKETAVYSPDMGMYWPKNSYGYYWYQSPIETQSLMIELFTEAGDNDKDVEEMKIWLLRNKQTQNWKTTKATAAACYALLMHGTDNLVTTFGTSIKIGGRPLETLKPATKSDAGTGYTKTNWTGAQIQPTLGKVELKNDSKTISWGAMYWQYLENMDKVTPAQTNIRLERNYFIQQQTTKGVVLIAVDAAHQPQVGNVLKVVVNLKADRDFEYVQLKDVRPAGTEPVDILSGYKYQDGLGYYQVTRDASTNFFISDLQKGNYVFEYELRVAQPGNFSTGITTIQSLYAPEFSAHSTGMRMVIRP